MSRTEKWLIGALGLCVLAVYAYVAAGPLRAFRVWNGDGRHYVALASWILHGRLAGMPGVPLDGRQFPLGYPAILALMSRLGLSGPRTLIAFNLLCDFVGLSAFYLILRDQISSLGSSLAVIFAASSAIMCGLVATVASEPPFLAASSLCLLSLERKRILLGTVLCGAAISIRSAGLALIPAVFVTAFLLPSVRSSSVRRAAVVAVALSLCTAVSVWLLRSNYLRVQVIERFSGAHYASVSEAVYLPLVYKLRSVGEAFTNLAAADFPGYLRDEFAVLGVLALILMAVGTRGHVCPSSVYLWAYLFMLLAYPWFGAQSQGRFLMPLLPLLFGLAWKGGARISGHFERKKSIRTAALFCVALVALVGCVKIVGQNAPDRHDASGRELLRPLEAA